MSSKSSILEIFLDKGNKAAEQIAQQVIENKNLLTQIYNGVTGSNKRVKNAAAKTMQILSARKPNLLYPRFAFFVQLIEGEDTILKWIAIDVLGNVSSADTKNSSKVIDTFYKSLRGSTPSKWRTKKSMRRRLA